MGELITFPSNGGTCSGYLSHGGGPGVIVISEWWGLVPHIVDVTDRFGDAGFTALAPDLYDGKKTTEPDVAAKMARELDLSDAAKDLSGAVDLLVDTTSNPRVGVVGYCLGGGLALMLAARRPDAVKAVAPYYGLIPSPDAQPDWSAVDAKIVGEYAELDEYYTPDLAAELQAALRGLGKDATLNIHEGAHHAFFNDSRHEVYDAEHALEAWERTLTLFREELNSD